MARLMRREGIRGAERRGRPGKTTTSDAAAEQRPDLVCRDFAAERPNELRVADLTQVPLDDHGVKQSLGSVGDALDNALAVSWVDSLKTELIADRAWRTRGQLELAIVEYIGWFNHLRVHSSLSYTPPAEFEQRQLEQLQLPLTGRIPDNGSVADASLKAANGLRTRPGSTTGVDFAADGLTLPKAAPARTAQPRSQDHRPRLVSPLYGSRTLARTPNETRSPQNPVSVKPKAVQDLPSLPMRVARFRAGWRDCGRRSGARALLLHFRAHPQAPHALVAAAGSALIASAVSPSAVEKGLDNSASSTPGCYLVVLVVIVCVVVGCEDHISGPAPTPISAGRGVDPTGHDLRRVRGGSRDRRGCGGRAAGAPLTRMVPFKKLSATVLGQDSRALWQRERLGATRMVLSRLQAEDGRPAAAVAA